MRRGAAAPPFMPLRLTDTLTGELRAVRATSRGSVGLYVCGPTVYDAAHVGHARTYLCFDVARRVLEAQGYRVRHVMNVTDLEDKIDQRAASLGLTSRALARAEEHSFFRDLAAFGNLPPTFRPRASAYVPQILQVARALEKTGRVRRIGDEWRYEAPERPPGENFATTADLARHAVEEPGHPFGGPTSSERSFLIWKRVSPPLPTWMGLWGRGAPGWHLQCFAMAGHLLDNHVDFHGGGRDLVYPHHFAENEIALALRGEPFTRVFLHGGLVLEGGAKMSKSQGNLVSLRSALASRGRDPLRWHLLGRPFRERFPWDDRVGERDAEEFRLLRATLRKWLRGHGNGPAGARTAAKAARDVERALLRDLACDRARERVTALAAEVGHSAGGLPPGERPAARAALGRIEALLGIALA